MALPVKRAIKRLVRGDDGQVGVVLIDIDTHLPVLDPTGYKILSVSDQPEPVASIETPNIPSILQPPVIETPLPTRADFDRQASQTTQNVSPQANTNPRSLASTNPSATLNPVSSPRISPVMPDQTSAQPGTRVAPVGSIATVQGSVLPDFDLNKFAPTPGSGLVKDAPPTPAKGLGLAALAPNGLGNPDEKYKGMTDRAINAVKMMETNRPGPTGGLISGYRDPKTNRAVGGQPNSSHLLGDAGDVQFTPGMTDEQKSRQVEIARLNEGVRIGAYSPEKSLHIDFGTSGVKENAATAKKYSPDAYPMFNTSINNMEEAPDWFTKGLKQDTFPSPTPNPRGQGFAAPTVDERGITKTNSVFDDIAPQEKIMGLASPGSGTGTEMKYGDLKTASPAKMAASGRVARTPEQIKTIGHMFAGELGPEQLDALLSDDPTAKREYANMMASLENRAASQKYKTLEGAIRPSQYNSLKPDRIHIADGNYAKYGKVLDKLTKDFYVGGLIPDSFDITSYYNPDAVERIPAWDNKGQMKDRTQTGPHLFGSLPEYSPSKDFIADRVKEVGKFTRENYTGTRTGANSPIEKSGIGRGSQTTQKTEQNRDRQNAAGRTGIGATNRDRQGADGKVKDKSKGLSASRESSKSKSESKGKSHARGGRNAD